MLIYLIRHGETVWNRAGRYQGWQDIPLSPAGRQELRRAEICPETVYVTPLSRTRETAEILFPGARYIPVTGLREMCFGDFEGRNYMEMEHDRAYRDWVDGGCLGKCPGGESRAEFSARVVRAFTDLVNTALSQNESMLVIVAHGGTVMSALERYGRPEKSYYDWLPDNGSGYVLETGLWPEALTVQKTVCYKKV